MDPITVQNNLSLTIQTPLGDNVIIIDSLEGVEGISIPFEFTLNVHADDIDVDFSKLLQQPVTVAFKEDQGNTRYFNGIVGKISQDQAIVTTDVRRGYYKIVIYPTFWLLNFSKDHRIFQNQSTLDIVKALLGEGQVQFDDKCQQKGQGIRPYCVQYGETTFNFISRLLEEDGIYYTFQHTADAHTLILTDDSLQDRPIPNEKKVKLITAEQSFTYMNCIQLLNVQEQVVSKEFKSVDYNYESAGAKLLSTVGGVGLVGSVYEYPGLFQDMAGSESVSNTRIQELEWQKRMINGDSTVPHFLPGLTFTLDEHPRAELNRDYFIYKVYHTIDQRGGPLTLQEDGSSPEQTQAYQNQFEAFPSDIPFRPLRATFKPRIFSNQTAIVTGPPGEEVFCDAYGRIKVQFYWDLRGGMNESSSCWVRVAQNWAGGGWGGFVLPRIGMEVVVTYLEGDPDRPLVIGCVYNSSNMPPYAGSEPTKTTLKSNTSKGGGGYNELRFEDTGGSEEIYLQAQKDMNVLIKHDRHELLQGDIDILTMPKASKYVIQTGGGTQYTFSILNGNKSTLITSGNDVLKIDTGDRTGKIGSGNHKFKIGSGDNIFKIGAGNRNYTIGAGDSTFKIGAGNYTRKIGAGNYLTKIGAGNHTTKIGSGNREFKIGAGNSTFKIGAGNYKTKIGAGNREFKIGAGNSKFKIGSGNYDIKIGAGNYGVKIGAGNHKTKIGAGNREFKIGAGNYKTKIGSGKHSTKIGAGKYSVDIGAGKHSTKIGAGNYSIKIGAGNLSIKVNGNISLKATGAISLKAGLSISQKSLSIQTKGLMVQTKAGVMLKMKGLMVQTKGLMVDLKGLMTMVKGALVKIN